ncbi:MAG: hypothetical protein HN742_11645 [Lentisphaerae bacterium]|jgi:hypothetical protein|nr:hypothetical protein [Lentisphaerota bacterium]MBT4814195.1 hypothetical protein [Lentisphaerota bacterium]MBT5609606.1 hypothetical protein [Lentisphaerota bacterium]MBT7060884.1 hypothetical protein [Lentisphaerota bacterium]MBT7842521.1 hypothetical protein [Lentisphaerota bacterium]
MNDGKHELAGCPSVEDLSAFHDDALNDGSVGEHVADCTSCRSTIDTYTVIDDAVQSLGDTPANLAERIQEQCKSLKPEPLMFRVMGSPIWRHAAAAAAVALIAVAIHYAVDSSSPASSSHAAAISPEDSLTHAPETVVVVPPAELPQLPPQPGPEYTGRDGAIPSTDLTRVNAGGTAKAVPGTVSLANAVRKAIVPPRVKHVWVVKNVEEAIEMLQRALPEGISCTTTGDIGNKASLQLLLTDEQLQALVDRLAEAGWPLLSPGVPQPRKGAELLLSRSVVRYDIDLVIPGRE